MELGSAGQTCEQMGCGKCYRFSATIQYLRNVKPNDLQLLRTASLSANVFNLEHGKLLLSVDKGWLMQDIIKFVLSREEVDKVVKDNKDMFPGQLEDEDVNEL